MRLSSRFRLVVLTILLAIISFTWACASLDWSGAWDETCYDCRTVCEGTQGIDRDDCLSSCHDCQGYLLCFALLEWQFDGQTLAASDWDQVDCNDVE